LKNIVSSQIYKPTQESKKVLVLNDFIPKKTGVFSLLKGICDGIEFPLQTEWVNIRDLNMASCAKCLKCGSYGECLLPEDDAHRIGRKIFQANALVIGLDSNVERVSLAFKTLLERCSAIITMQKSLDSDWPWSTERFVVIASLEDDRPGEQSPVKRYTDVSSRLLRVLREAGFKLVGELTEHLGGKISTEARKFNRAKMLGERLQRCLFSSYSLS
jgi:multimeric flavodoxin WrbA